MRPPARLALLLLALAPLALTGCPQFESQKEPRTTLVKKKLEIPGEDELLHMEDERSTFEGKLKKFLSDRDPKVRRRAAQAAGRIGDKSLVEEIRVLLTDKDKDVRGMAAYSAGLLGEPSLGADVEKLLGDGSYYVRSSALVGRSLIGGDAVPPLVKALLSLQTPDEPSKALAGEACLAVTRFRDASVAELVAPLVGHPDAEVRWRAAYALYRLKQDGPRLAAALKDPEPRVRAFAALGVGSTMDADAVPDVIELLKDADTTVVAAAAAALAQLKDARAAQPLADLAGDAVPRRRYAAIWALSRSGLAPETLQGLLKDPSPWIRALAVEGIHRAASGATSGATSASRAAGRPSKSAASGPTNAAARAAIAAATKDPEWRVRAAAARALTDLGDVDALSQMRYDNDAKVIPPVLEGLARLGYRDLDNVLLKHLGDTQDVIVRATAARLITGRKVPGAIDNLVASYNASRQDDILLAKLAILEALKGEAANERALNILKQGVMDQNWLLKKRAYAILEGVGAAQGFEPPTRVVTLRTESYYADLVSRGDFDHHAEIDTDKGKIVFRLNPKQAPLSVRFLDEVASSGYYDDKPFTELVPAVEIVGGDDRGDGFGQYPAFERDEPNETPFQHVSLTFKRALGRDSATSQFGIEFLPRPDLDGEATNLGEILSGAEVLDQLVPGDKIRSIAITVHEFRGKFVLEKVELDRPSATGPAKPTEASGSALQAGGTAVHPGWTRPPTILYMAIVGGVMLLASLAPVLLSAEKREDFPLGLWAFLLLLLLVAGAYTYVVMSGQYFDVLTSERPGPRRMDVPNPPILANDQATLACTGVMAYVVFELALLFFLMNGRSFARWVFLFLSLVEAAMFTAQIGTGLALLSLVSQIGIGVNALKIWFLLMDRKTKEYLAN